jgi:hypothetical protein
MERVRGDLAIMAIGNIIWGNIYDGAGANPATTTGAADYTIPWIYVNPTSTTEISVIIMTPATTPGSYAGVIYSSGSTASDPDFTFTDTNGIFSKTGLIPGTTYTIRARCYSGSAGNGTYGAYAYEVFTMPKPATVATVVQTVSGSQTPNNTTYDPLSGTFRTDSSASAFNPSTGTDFSNSDVNDPSGIDTSSIPAVPRPSGTSIATSNNKTVTKSLFTVTSKDTLNETYSLVEKVLPITTTSSYYSFGTSLFFDSLVANTSSGGGIGFFTTPCGTGGYFLLIKTTANTNEKNPKDVSIIKVVGNQAYPLRDDQETSAKRLGGIYGAVNYKVDIKVEINSGIVIIDAYVNNVKITARDIPVAGSTNPAENILPVTNRVAMFTNKGKTSFDYIYAMPTTKEYYESTSLLDIYQGQFGSATLNFMFGEKLLGNASSANIANGVIEEFGTIAREIRYVSAKFESRPGYPLYTSTGINPHIQVLGQKLSSFGAELYVINNAGVFTPLDDGNLSSFTVVGNYIVQSGQQEYSEKLANEFSNQEPVAFQSTWIQNEDDAKSLSKWIKNQWSKQQQVLNIEIFSNPLLSIGDIVSVKYTNNNLDGTGKFVVTNVSQNYSEGLGTSITVRSIYS